MALPLQRNRVGVTWRSGLSIFILKLIWVDGPKVARARTYTMITLITGT